MYIRKLFFELVFQIFKHITHYYFLSVFNILNIWNRYVFFSHLLNAGLEILALLLVPQMKALKEVAYDKDFLHEKQ